MTRLRLTLPAHHASARVARQALETLGLTRRMLEDARIVVSELMAQALCSMAPESMGQELELEVGLRPTAVRIAVHPPEGCVPIPEDADFGEARLLVLLASSWGVMPGPRGTLWAEIVRRRWDERREAELHRLTGARESHLRSAREHEQIARRREAEARRLDASGAAEEAEKVRDVACLQHHRAERERFRARRAEVRLENLIEAEE